MAAEEKSVKVLVVEPEKAEGLPLDLRCYGVLRRHPEIISRIDAISQGISSTKDDATREALLKEIAGIKNTILGIAKQHPILISDIDGTLGKLEGKYIHSTFLSDFKVQENVVASELAETVKGQIDEPLVERMREVVRALANDYASESKDGNDKKRTIKDINQKIAALGISAALDDQNEPQLSQSNKILNELNNYCQSIRGVICHYKKLLGDKYYPLYERPEFISLSFHRINSCKTLTDDEKHRLKEYIIRKDVVNELLAIEAGKSIDTYYVTLANNRHLTAFLAQTCLHATLESKISLSSEIVNNTHTPGGKRVAQITKVLLFHFRVFDYLAILEQKCENGADTAISGFSSEKRFEYDKKRITTKENNLAKAGELKNALKKLKPLVGGVTLYVLDDDEANRKAIEEICKDNFQGASINVNGPDANKDTTGEFLQHMKSLASNKTDSTVEAGPSSMAASSSNNQTLFSAQNRGSSNREAENPDSAQPSSSFVI